MDHTSSISTQEIADQLGRILSYPVFTNSSLLSGFLRFIINETLEGRGQQLKEYTIGIEVMSKKGGYDTKEDASVRIHAGRLRKALQAYYAGPGKNDVLLITVPKGTYQPEFEMRSFTSFLPAAETAIPYFKPSIAILPFHYYDKERDYALADGLCDQLCTEFSNFNELAVISYYSSRKVAESLTDLRKAAMLLDAGYMLTGNILSNGDSLRISIQLVAGNTLQMIWAHTYERERSALNTFTIQDDIVRHVVNQIAGSHGIIFRDAVKNAPPDRVFDIKVYDSVFWYYYLVNELSEELFHKALASMKEAVRLNPKYALGWAFLAETYVAGYFYYFDCGVEDPLKEAVKCGKEALRIDLRCQHAYQSLGLAYLFLHQKQDCLQIVERWIQLKSNSASIAGGLGFCLICCGDYERGYQMIYDSIHLNPYYQWWFNAGLSIYHFNKREYDDAIYWANKLYGHNTNWGLILKTASYFEMGYTEQAKQCFDELNAVLPTFMDPLKMVVAFLQQDDLTARLSSAISACQAKDMRSVPDRNEPDHTNLVK